VSARSETRADAREATDELRRRLPDVDLRPFHQQARKRSRATGRPQPAASERAAGAVQSELASTELRRAAELAELARRTLDQRQAQSQRNADLERQHEADEPSPDRWPHRDPGYQLDAMRRRQTERAAAQLAAQDFRAAVPDLAGARNWPQPERATPGRQLRQIERDEPEATL